jgi:hypothetical protein
MVPKQEKHWEKPVTRNYKMLFICGLGKREAKTNIIVIIVVIKYYLMIISVFAGYHLQTIS